MLHSDRKWNGARWIGAGFEHLPWHAPSRPAPFFRKTFHLHSLPREATVFVAAPGWMELYINGRRFGDGVLQPNPSQFDKLVYYVQYDVSSYLQAGDNVIGIVLGNGWYDCSTVTDWHSEYAPWHDYPKFLLELIVDNAVTIVSDSSWQCLRQDGPIVFNELRNGEYYDARKEQSDWCVAQNPCADWDRAQIVAGPGGYLMEQHCEPCRVMQEFPAELFFDTQDGGVTYALPQNISGWARIRIQGEAGASIKLIYSELIDERYRSINRKNDITRCVKSGEFQTDCYTLKGEGIEDWHPHFTYHGFQYLRVEITGNAKLLAMYGCAIHTDFKQLCDFNSTDDTLNRLCKATQWSFLDNNVGVSTDCPHREKNIWAGDALISARMGLTFYDAGTEFAEWLRSFRANQLNSGAACALAITPGWGYTWGTGTGDFALVFMPWLIYLYTGHTEVLRENYPAMLALMDFLEEIEEDGILNHGLGDWFCLDEFEATPRGLCSTAYYYLLYRTMPKIEKVLDVRESRPWNNKAEEVRQAFQNKWCTQSGHVHQDEMTALSLALEFDLCPEEQRECFAKTLNDVVVAKNYKPDYGMVGGHVVLRALANNGYAETAFKLLTQPAYPGYVDMLNHGATTLWESWDGRFSHNHIMFGDIAAWMVEFLGGIRLDEKHPGYEAITIRPFCPDGLKGVSVWRETPKGRVDVCWNQEAEFHSLYVTIPDGLACTVILPNGERYDQTDTTRNYQWK